VVLGFLFLTISRTGWMTAAVMAAFALIFLGLVTARKNWIGKLFQNGLLLLLCLCITFPLVFGAVRYLPPVFHHPVWFWGEWSEDKVHSWDKWDSEKFINLDRLMQSVNKRVANILDSWVGNTSDHTETELPDAEASDIAEVDTEATGTEVSPLQQQLYDEMLAEGYALDPADRTSGVKVRKAIYRYYFHLLNFWGHSDSELGYQMLPDHRIGHAHNIYLQYGVAFGIPAMLLFIILIGWSVVGFVKRFAAGGSEKAAGSLLFLLVPAVFGLLEYCWGAGSLTITLLFVIWRRMLCDEREQ
jgi:energy-coupling factor transporter transmembrane protein EcfT